MSATPRIPRYDLLEEVGSGGMSVVYRARDTTLDREVAVKVLHRHLAGKDSERRRFRQEAMAVARLRHPNILEIHDYAGDDAEEAYIVSELVRGPTLRVFAETTGFGLPEIGAMVATVLAGALAHAHALGVIHRDIKPENVMIQDDGTVKLTDFGVARMVDRDERMTMTGALLGSPAHMAPESLEGGGGDVHSDVFSLGTVLYWLACGALPYTGSSPAEVLRRIAEGRHTDPRAVDPRVSDELATIIEKAIARDPANRWQSAEELAQALDAYLADLGIDRPAEALARFFDDPADYKATLQAELVARLTERARAATDTGAVPAALAACDRLLALDPGNAEALACLDRLHRRRRRRRIVAAGLSAALLGGGVLAVAAWPGGGRSDVSSSGAPAAPHPAHAATNPPSRAPARPEPAANAHAAKAHAANAHAANAHAANAHAANAHAGDAHAGDAHAANAHAANAHRTLRILVEPFATITVDGKRLARDREARAELPLGPHRLAITRQGFVPLEETVKVAAGTGAEVVRRRLVPKPAILHIVNGQRAAVSIDGKLKGTVGPGGLDLPVTFPERPDQRYQLEVPVDLRLEKVGFQPLEKKLTVKPGQHVTLPATLEPAK